MRIANQNGFWSRVWQELQPLLRHTIVFSVTMLVFVIVAFFFRFLQQYLPEKSEHIKWIEKIDVLLIYTLLTLFGFYAIAEVAIRSVSGIHSLVKEKFGSQAVPAQKELRAVLSVKEGQGALVTADSEVTSD